MSSRITLKLTGRFYTEQSETARRIKTVGVKRIVEQSRKAAEKQKASMAYNFLTHFRVTLEEIVT